MGFSLSVCLCKASKLIRGFLFYRGVNAKFFYICFALMLKYARTYSWLIFLVLFTACTNSGPSYTSTPESFNEEFSLYMNQFGELKLPITIKGCEIVSSTYLRFDGNSFGNYALPNTLAFGKLSNTTKYVAALTLAPGDCYLPILTIYTPNGKLLDKKVLMIDSCRTACGFTCEKVAQLDTNYTFYVADTITSFLCDDLGHETPGTYEHYVNFITGKILPNGRIVVTEQQKKTLEYKPSISR